MSGSFWGKMGGQKTGKDFDISASKKAVEQSNELPDDLLWVEDGDAVTRCGTVDGSAIRRTHQLS